MGEILRWHPHPDVWALAAALLGGYLYLVRRIGPRHATDGKEPVTRHQITMWFLGVVTLLVAADYPIHDLAERSLYSVHMVQHLMFTMVMPPLLLLGMPAWMFRVLLARQPLRRVVKFLSRPFFALVLFNTVIVLTHWPAVVTAAVGHELVHFGIHAVLVFAALIMWMPVLSPVIEIPRLSYPGQMVYLFLQSLVPTVPASFLTFGSRPLYHVYEAFTRPGGMSALTDQRMAGLIMKIVGGAILWGWIGVLFFRWYAMEKTGGVDALNWRDVDRQLNRMELSK
ncbi:MAG: cytochrome c oxidase assembly protein [Actinomycetota bacterium]|nr:cytochrome c oxidase assembly protein [Actinomycetota bacterium]